jgi:hypothetical protein
VAVWRSTRFSSATISAAVRLTVFAREVIVKGAEGCLSVFFGACAAFLSDDGDRRMALRVYDDNRDGVQEG